MARTASITAAAEPNFVRNRRGDHGPAPFQRPRPIRRLARSRSGSRRAVCATMSARAYCRHHSIAWAVPASPAACSGRTGARLTHHPIEW